MIWFKLVFIAGFVVAVRAAASTAKRATNLHGGSVNQLAHEVRGLIIVRSVLGLIFYAALLSWLFWPSHFTWSYLPVPMGVRWLALGLFLFVIAFLDWSYRTLGTNYRGGVGLHDKHELVRTGPYRIVRHPIYISFILVMVLTFLISANWVLGLSGLLLVSSIAIVRISIEEAELKQRFGPSWDDYRERTGSILPRL